MTDLNDIVSLHAAQDAGAELAIINPITNEVTDLKFWIAGPDSNVQRRAREWAAAAVRSDALMMAAPDHPMFASTRRRIATGMLARSIVRWDIRQDGKPVPLSTENAIRVLNASEILRDQVDAFAASRDPWRPKKGAADAAV